MTKDFGNLIPGAILCQVPENILTILRNHFYKISKLKPDIHESDYKQWFVQKANKTAQLKNIETDYVIWHWIDNESLNDVRHFFLQYVDGIYRFRYSSMPPTHKIDYHKPHNFPRIHIPLNEAKTNFQIEVGKEKFDFLLKSGYAYILNVVFPHTATCDSYREHCFFSFNDFANDELKSLYWKNDI